MNSLVLTYIPGVCVFPARSGFTPGWAYVLNGLRAQSRVSPVVGLLPLASGPQLAEGIMVDL